jgi:hypothetical protein
MQNRLSLDELHQNYVLGVLNKKEFEGLIFKHILANYQQFYLPDWSKDKCIDYLCGLYPRLTLAIDAYKNVGASFERYIKSKLYWFVKERRSRESDHLVTEYACWEAWSADKDSFMDPVEPEYQDLWAMRTVVSNPRQILILLLKSYFFVSDEFACRIAPFIGVQPEKLIELLDELRSRRFDRDQEIRKFRERLHSQYYRCIAYERRLKARSEDSAHHQRMKGQLKRARERYISMKKRYAGVNVDATNRQIAEVLGIPKGTVDSNLYAVKQKIKPQPQNP